MQQRNKIYPLVISSTIRRVLAGFLLVIFAFGITPKRTLHNLVANHKDGSAKDASRYLHETELSRSTFNCQCDNLVTESPFVAESSITYLSLEIVFPSYQSNLAAVPYSSERISFGLRGPPLV